MPLHTGTWFSRLYSPDSTTPILEKKLKSPGKASHHIGRGLSLGEARVPQKGDRVALPEVQATKPETIYCKLKFKNVKLQYLFDQNIFENL